MIAVTRMSNPYSKADKAIAYLIKKFGRLFRNVTAFDELNVIDVSNEIYEAALTETEQAATQMAKSVYDAHREEDEISEEDANGWVLALMLAYNPVTKYIFRNEIDRKRSRFAEGVIASDTPRDEVDLAKRLLVATTKQFLDDATFDTIVKAFKDDGIEEVRWVTAVDDRRCKQCASRHNKIYPIDKIPSKPHLHCRCYVEAVEVTDGDADS